MKKSVKIIGTSVLSLLLVIGAGLAILFNNGLSGMHKTNSPKDGQIKVACVGDSITYGHGITNWAKENYPSVLQNLLGEDYCVNNYGVSGYCVQVEADKPYVSTDRYEESLAFEADVLVFMLGTNDAKPYNWVDVETFEKDYTSLLTSYIKNNQDIEVYLCTPATAFDDDETTPTSSFDIQPGVVEEIADFVRKYAMEHGHKLIDINDVTEGKKDWFSSDLIHPNNLGAKEIATEISKHIKKDHIIMN